MTGRYMLATTAHHKLGDISRDESDLAWITGEDGDDWIGKWVEGFGYFDIRFPKVSTRELTDVERERYDGRELAMNGRPWGRIDFDDQEDAR